MRYDDFDDGYGYGYGYQGGGTDCRCRCRCGEPAPIPRLHTPEREEACLVEGRFGCKELDAVPALLDAAFERRGTGWVDRVVVDGRPWLRAAIWLTAPDKIHIEATSREAFERVATVVKALPPGVRQRSTREHPYAVTDRYLGHSGQRLNRNADRAGCPLPGPAEVLDGLVEAEERRWLQAPHPQLDDVSPEEAAKADSGLHQLYALLERAARRGREEVGLNPACDMDRIRQALGMGRRW